MDKFINKAKSKADQTAITKFFNVTANRQVNIYFECFQKKIIVGKYVFENFATNDFLMQFSLLKHLKKIY